MKNNDKQNRAEVAINAMKYVIDKKKNLKHASLDLGFHFGFLSQCVGNIDDISGTKEQKKMLSDLYLQYRILVAKRKIKVFFGGGSQLRRQTPFPSVLRVASKRSRMRGYAQR